MKNFYFLIFVVMTFLCWGLYGPVLHVGQVTMGGGHGQRSLLRPLICVGFAYFLIAVLFPLIVLQTKGETGSWSASGFIWSFAAGAIGAIGALGIVLAFKFQGKPFYVMPLVFGLAPIINTFVTMAMARTFKEASPLFYVGILIVAIGAAGVLINKPTVTKTAVVSPTSAVVKTETSNVSLQESSDASAEAAVEKKATEEKATEGKNSIIANDELSETPKSNPLAIALSIALTALCWGAYGPVLHKGQAKMDGSRLRPFLCVGLAYFVIAVVGPMLLLGTLEDPGSFDNLSGVAWSFAAGATGAIGALGIIYAFNFGGKPLFVMPLVFGFAPVVNTFYEIVTKNLYGQVPTLFFVSLGLVITGAVMVLVLAPRKKRPAPAVAT